MKATLVIQRMSFSFIFIIPPRSSKMLNKIENMLYIHFYSRSLMWRLSLSNLRHPLVVKIAFHALFYARSGAKIDLEEEKRIK